MVFLYEPCFMTMDRTIYCNRLARREHFNIEYDLPTTVLNNFLEHMLHSTILIEGFCLDSLLRRNDCYKEFANKAYQEDDWDIAYEV